ncbi:MAG TPA: TonB-dependent receptor [Steroidobacteraceae bacterium]|nr:TonB-dependent receptor [Steroidobacteraceae bacterium]
MRNQFRWFGLPLSALACMATGRAPAAVESTGSDALAEVVVTAEKRSESQQSVPLSITTFGSAQLQDKAINTFFDYATKVPNLAFAATGDGVGTARTISIRGISGDNVTAMYIDETPLPDSLDPRVLDIDHIEVLRGPQGDLYGARSMGGTVRIITKQADFENVSGSVHAAGSSTAHTDKGNYTGDAVVNIPLIKDTVALRASGFYDAEAGYFKRSYCTNPATAGVTCFPLSTTGVTTVSNVGATNTYGGAISLAIKATDDLTITPRMMVQRTDLDGFPMADYNTMPGNGWGFPVPSGAVNVPAEMEPRTLTQARLFNTPEGGYDKWDLYSLGVKWSTAVGELVSSTAYFDRRVDETENESEFIYAAVTSGAGGTPVPAPIEEIKNYQRFVQEVRWASSLKGPVQFVAGAFFSDFHGRLPYAGEYPGATAAGLDATLLGPGNGELTPGYPDLVFKSDFHTDIKEPALFGNVSYTFFDALKATAGLRWYSVKTTSAGYEEGLVTGGGPAVVSPQGTSKESGVNPKLELDYHLDADKMLYGVASKGFRPGGLVPAVPAGAAGTTTDCVAALHALNPNITLEQTRSFHSDSLWNYEGGFKTSWFDHRVTVDGAGFYIDWKNIQQEILLSCGFQYTANAGAATSKGGELEVRARPLQPLELSLGVGYQDARITKASAFSPQAVGSPVYNVPDWTANAAATYHVALSGDWLFVGGADWSYIGRSYSGNNDPSTPRERPSYRLINARLALQRGGFEVAFVGKNLADELTNLGDNRSIAAEVPGRPRLFVNQPRTVGLEVRQSF